MSDLTVELRGPTKKSTVDVIDAYSMARRMSRMDLVNQILTEWVETRLHETSVVLSISRGNPELTEKLGIKTENP